MIKCIFFDFDGTLIDSNEIKRQTFYDLTKDIDGASAILDRILNLPNLGDRSDIFNALKNELQLKRGVQIDALQLTSLYTKKCEYRISCAPEIDGAYNALKDLKKKSIKVFISSATPQKELNTLIDLIGWKDYIDLALGSPNSKVEHVKKIQTENNYCLSEIIYIGDSEIDRNTSIILGCHFIGIGKDNSRFNKRPKILLSNLNNIIAELELFKIL